VLDETREQAAQTAHTDSGRGRGEAIVPVAAGNVGSWRALERAGFVRVAEGDLEPDNPVGPPLHYVYARRGGAGELLS
jgi:RimJ/RimL family protein N-acetyltransferase